METFVEKKRLVNHCYDAADDEADEDDAITMFEMEQKYNRFFLARF